MKSNGILFAYGGNGSDWVLVTVDGSGNMNEWSFNLANGQFSPDGCLATTFGNQGVAILPLNGWGNAQDMTLLANGEVLAGGTITPSTYKTYMFLAKYQVSGNPTSYANVSQTTTYTYDVRGKLSSVSVNGNLEATYTYDDAGNRVSETVGGVTTLYLNDTMNPTGYAEPIEAKITATGKPVTTWITGDRVYGQADANGGMTYLLADGHGSTRLLTNANGTVTAAFNYDAFGTAINFNPGMAATPFLFGGDAFYDAPSGLYIHGDGTRARLEFFFIQRDDDGYGRTQDPLSLHRYLYVDANPVNKNDPTGHFGLDDSLLAVGEGAAIDLGEAGAANGAEVIAEGVVEDAEEAGIELAEDVENVEQVMEGHHPIPKYLGGDEEQELYDISESLHDELHADLKDALEEAFEDEPGYPGKNGSAADWAQFFKDTPGAQGEAGQVIQDLYAQYDSEYGTSLLQAFEDNIASGNFTSF